MSYVPFIPRQWTKPAARYVFGTGPIGYVLVNPRRHIADIQRAVAAEYNLPVNEMVSDRRARDIARPRQVAMYLSRRMTPASLPEIGRRFGNRDHTTVIHAIRTIEGRRLVEPELDAHVRALEARL